MVAPSSDFALGFPLYKTGWKYMDYQGNKANDVWDGVPQVMAKHNISLPAQFAFLYI
jgi:hypothetical protein